MADLSINFAGIKSPNPFWLSLILCLLFAVQPSAAQEKKAVVPKSKIINAEQLLNDLRVLSADDMQGRLVGTPGGLKAREYIVRRFKESGIEPFNDSYLQPFEFANQKKPNEKIQGANVVGFIKGKQTPEKYIVISAHYDHLGIRDGKIYNGADDNASGTAALFILGEYFKKHRPDYTLVFVADDAEEGGGWGMRKFVAEPPVKKEAIVLDVNVDMISRDKNDILYAVGTYHYPFLKPFLERVAAQAPVKLLLGHDNPNQKDVEDWTGDQSGYAFHREKIPFIYFGVEDFEQHHQPTDDYETTTTAFYVRAVETVIAAVKEFDKNLPQIEKQKAA